VNDDCIGVNPGHGANGYEWNSVQWSSDGSEVYAADGDSSSPSFYTIPVNSDGFGSVTAYSLPFIAFPSNPQLYFSIHYEPVSGYVFSDSGQVLNTADGSVVATLNHSGAVIPDGNLGAVFVLWWNNQSNGYELDSFDIQSRTLIASQILPGLIGSPVKLIRWGSDGLALLTLVSAAPKATPQGAIYILEGPFIGNPKSAAN